MKRFEGFKCTRIEDVSGVCWYAQHMYVIALANPSGGVRGVQMHPPLAASNVILRT